MRANLPKLSPCPRKLHPSTFEGGANTRFGNVRELKVVHDIVRNRLEPLNLNLSDLSVVEKLQIGQHLVHRTVALMLQQTFPLQEYDGSPDNLLFGQAEIVMCGSRYQLDLVEELAIGQLDIAFRIARRVVKFLDVVMLAVPKRGSRGKRRRRRHENNHPGAV